MISGIRASSALPRTHADAPSEMRRAGAGAYSGPLQSAFFVASETTASGFM